MARPEGLPKTGGRTKGTPNKKTNHLESLLADVNIDVVRRISEILPTLSPREQVDTLLSLMPYLYPKRKTVDLFVETESTSPVQNMTNEELNAAMAQNYRDNAAMISGRPEVKRSFEVLAKFYEDGGDEEEGSFI